MSFWKLPSGTRAIACYTLAGHEDGLPSHIQSVIYDHFTPTMTSRSDTCEILFSMSGHSAAQINLTKMMPKDIRDMGSWVLSKCNLSSERREQ